jgi:hypothetical protein
LLTDPLERDPPRAALPFLTSGQRVEVDLAGATQRQRWRTAFVAPVEAALVQLPACGVRVHVLGCDVPSDSWLPSRGRARAA